MSRNENLYQIRTMARNELDIAVEWAAKEGWNPGLNDADCFYTADPNGFFIGLLKNEPISFISAVAYNKSFGFIGFYIVKPEFRGKGYGLQIWNKAIEYLKIQNIGLDGVVDQQENYKKSGFKLAYRNIRFQGTGGGKNKFYPNIVKLSEIPFDDLKKYDDCLFPASRLEFLKCWINQPESLALGALDNGKLVGYSVIRKCEEGYKIAPLFANNKNIAEKLFQSMSAFVKNDTPIFLDVPETNPAAINLTNHYRMKKVFETARMYSKKPPDLPINKIFGVTTFELG